MYRRQRLAIIALSALCLAQLIQPAFASVGLVDFSARPTTNNTILVSWETATETDITGFKLYRSLTGSSDWLDLIPEGVGALGTAQGGAEYSFEDTQNIVEGVRYYYLLKEVTTSGDLIDLDTTSTGINLPAESPTITPTPSATWTQVAGSSRPTGSPTATPPRPTATRRFTDVPPTPKPGSPSPLPATTVPQLRTPTATPLPNAQVATPTGPAPKVTVAMMPTLGNVILADPLAATQAPPPTGTLMPVGAGTSVDTPTPVPTKDLTPVIFSSAPSADASPTPASAEQVAGQGRRSTTQALIIGGGAIGLAALLAAVYLFMRSRRS